MGPFLNLNKYCVINGLKTRNIARTNFEPFLWTTARAQIPSDASGWKISRRGLPKAATGNGCVRPPLLLEKIVSEFHPKECIILLYVRACLNLFGPGWNGWNGPRLLVVVSSIPSCLYQCIHLNFQATKQPTRTKNNPTDFCDGTAQLDPKTGVPSRGQRVLLTQKMTFLANTLV